MPILDASANAAPYKRSSQSFGNPKNLPATPTMVSGFATWYSQHSDPEDYDTMLTAITGATGFLGRYLVRHLVTQGYSCRCLCRATSDRSGFEDLADVLEWVVGDFQDPATQQRLVSGTSSVVHAALDRPGRGFRGAGGDVVDFAQKNLLGTLSLIEAARSANVPRFIFVSTCAVHEKILDDRPLDECHPNWATSHYGAYKGAVEMFIHSYGFGDGYPIAAIRPTGIYGLAHPAADSKWYDLVREVVQGYDADCCRGWKEVHAADVARGIDLLLRADGPTIAGMVFNCYDRYISELEVATLAKEISGSTTNIYGREPTPKHEISTKRIRALGMEFGGESLLRKTVEELVRAAQ